MSKALELKKEYEAKLDDLWQKRLAKIEADVDAYRQHLLDTDESYFDEAAKIQAVIDEIDKVMAEEDALAKKLDMIEAGNLAPVEDPIEEPIADAEVIDEPIIEDIPAPAEDIPAPIDADAPAEEIIEEPAPVVEEPKHEEAPLRRAGMMGFFNKR